MFKTRQVQPAYLKLLRGGRMTKWKGAVASISPISSGTFLAPLALVALAFPTGVAAQSCYTSPSDDVDDVVVCTEGGIISTWLGNDSITVESGTYVVVEGGEGDDLIIINGGQFIGSPTSNGYERVNGDTESRGSYAPTTVVGRDTIIINGGYFEDVDVHGDTRTVNVRSPNLNDDIIIVNGGNLENVYGDEGFERGTIIRTAPARIGNDSITINGGTIRGEVATDTDLHRPTLEGGDDTIDWFGGNINGRLFLGRGNDVVVIEAAEYDGTNIIDGGDGYSSADGWTDTLSLKGGVSGDILGANIRNWEIVNVDNTQVRFVDGILQVGSESGLGLFLLNGAIMDQSGIGLSLTGNLTNWAGITTQGGTAGDIISVTGNYAAASDLFLDVILNDGGPDNVPANDAAFADQLIIGGNVSGVTDVFITNVGGAGAFTDLNSNGSVDANEGILIVQAGGATPLDTATSGVALAEHFVLGAASNTLNIAGRNNVVEGAFAYDIYAIGSGASTNSTTDYVLASSGYQPTTTVSEALPLVTSGLQNILTLQQRVGNRFWAGNEIGALSTEFVFCKDPEQNFSCRITPEQEKVFAGSPTDYAIQGGGVWVRADAARIDINPTESATDFAAEQNSQSVEIGLDRVLDEGANGETLVGGVSLRYAQSRADVSSSAGNSSIDTNGFGLATTLTWYATDGLYVDAQARALWTSSDISTNAMGTIAEDVDGFGYVVSLEVGKEIALTEAWDVTPQVQLSYSKSESDDFTGGAATVTNLESESLALRAGTVLSNNAAWEAEDGTTSRRVLKVGTHVTKELRPENSVVVSGTTVTSEQEDVTGQITLGATYAWNDDKYSVYGEISASTGLQNFGDSRRVGATAGARIQWE